MQEEKIYISISAEGVLSGQSEFLKGTTNVDRILILPFKKTNEGLPNEGGNFVPDYGLAKQFNVDDFPGYMLMLDFLDATTYKVLVLAYGRSDYDFGNRGYAGNAFDLGALSSPESLDNIHLNLSSASVIPEIYVATCYAYNGNVLVGDYFKPSEITNLRGTMKRIVSGLSIAVTGIPSAVLSVELLADNLTKAVKLIGATPTVWQTSGDFSSRSLGIQVPDSGRVIFNKYLLPTFDSHKTKLFLNINYAGNVEHYTVNVADVEGVSSSDSIIFLPNQVVSISGDYSSNIGFTINNAINLDDNSWDGH
jgi:hypothetical protein